MVSKHKSNLTGRLFTRNEVVTMPDVYITITQAAPALLERLMTALEIRAADPQQRAMLDTYLANILGTLPT